MKIIELPQGFEKCVDTSCLYRLKPKKKKRLPENIELDIGKELYIYSHYTGDYRKYVLEENDPWLEKVESFILMGLTYHKP